VANVTKKQQPPSLKLSGSQRKGKVSARDSGRRNNTKKGFKVKKQEIPTPEVPEEESVLADDAKQPDEHQAQTQPSSDKRVDEEVASIGQDSPVTSRSISLAAARAAPTSERQIPEDDLTPAATESNPRRNFVASSSRSDGHKPVVRTEKRTGRSLRTLFVLLLLAAGPVAAVIGVNFQDYVISVSAQVDQTGKLRGLASDVMRAGNMSDEGAAKTPLQ
jgi:hypothetical protein